MRKLSILALAAIFASTAYATGSKPSNPFTPVTSSSQASSTSQAGSNSSVNSNFDGSNLYVFPAPVMAAPLPANLCPKGDSLSWSIGWNFFSYSISTTRTELECLEKTLALIKATQPVIQPTLAPLTDAERKYLACLEARPQPSAPVKKVLKTKKPDACKLS